MLLCWHGKYVINKLDLPGGSKLYGLSVNGVYVKAPRAPVTLLLQRLGRTMCLRGPRAQRLSEKWKVRSFIRKHSIDRAAARPVRATEAVTSQEVKAELKKGSNPQLAAVRIHKEKE